MKSNVNWPKAVEKWQKDHAQTGISAKEWCAKNALPYVTARRYIKLPKKTPKTDIKPALDNSAQSAHNSDAQSIENQTVKKTKPKEAAKTAQKTAQKRKSMQRMGNRNAVTHGFFSQHFGEAWEIAQHFDSSIRLQAVDAQLVKTYQVIAQYEKDLEELMEEVEGGRPTEEQFDMMNTLDKRIRGCYGVAGQLIDRANRLTDSKDNRKNSSLSRKRVVADTERIKVDTMLKGVGIGLAEKNTDKAEAQTKLSIAQLKALDKDDGGNKDDIDDIFDEIMEDRDGLMSEMPEDFDDE